VKLLIKLINNPNRVSSTQTRYNIYQDTRCAQVSSGLLQLFQMYAGIVLGLNKSLGFQILSNSSIIQPFDVV
jgi:cation transporter-like permease